MKHLYYTPVANVALLRDADIITESDSSLDDSQPAVTDPNDWH